jgi:hypothetical protein
MLCQEVPEISDEETPEGERDAIKQEQALETFVGKLEQYFDTLVGKESMRVHCADM